ncbi:hypothetical protein GmHk_09G026075 [Glycine max]|nr:hypothetical protein GmHk_09G026075 [Glycine max]
MPLHLVHPPPLVLLSAPVRFLEITDFPWSSPTRGHTRSGLEVRTFDSSNDIELMNTKVGSGGGDL